MAKEGYLEICSVGLVVGGNYVWYLMIVVIFMGFGEAGAKRCADALKSSIGVAMQAAEGGLFLEGRGILTM